MRSTPPTLHLAPAGIELTVAPGTRLQDALFAQGVEFPCGGRGRCRGCRVRVRRGDLPIVPEEADRLSAADLAAGWRLACQHTVANDLELELAQWEMAVLSDETDFPFTPREGLGIAIDLGTTTIAAQLLDRRTGEVLSSVSALNAQTHHGADIMSRIEFALHHGQTGLQTQIRRQLAKIVAELLEQGPPMPCARIILVGNTAMHHLFCGVDVAPLGTHPFQPRQSQRFTFQPHELGWQLPGAPRVEFLPCLGGFVGSDILAGIKATGLDRSAELRALVDLGTNGEVVVGSRDGLLCASTAAGPAFEGARISMGMRASTGAIHAAEIRAGQLVCHVLGGGPARGLCGSGLVDVVAAGLALGSILPDGRMVTKPVMPLADTVSLQPSDVRELQLAKGAIATGLEMLVDALGATTGDIHTLHLAGAFGNYISRAGARRIGLFDLPPERIVPSGNAALRGAKIALFEEPGAWDELPSRVRHVALGEDEAFPDRFAGALGFPP